LTWREKKVLVFDKDLKKIEELEWKKQGWGLTHNDTHMFISDGSSTIYVVDDQLSILQ
jgi:glutamine cyclotransferase